MSPELRQHRIPHLTLQSGRQVRDLQLAYVMHGQLNARRDNAILFPTWFAGTSAANAWIVGTGQALDPQRHCVIVVNAFGNGLSSSPSNHPELVHEGRPVPVSLLDNVCAQHDLVRALGIERLQAVVGRSMGAQQALQWACWYPEATERVFAFCGTPATTLHNRILLEAMAAPLEACLRGDLDAQRALEQAALVYAPWVVSHGFFNERCWGEGSAEDWIARSVTAPFSGFHPMDLLSLVRTWQQADISRNERFDGDLVRALRAIRAPVLLVPIAGDLIFPPQDFEAAERHIAGVRSSALRSRWGHRAAAPGSDPADIARLQAELAAFLRA